MLKRMGALWALVLLGGALGGAVSAEAAAPRGEKQPIFLLCPHNEGYSAWSLYLLVDPADPRKVLSLGLEKLKNVNLKAMSYAACVEAQSDPKIERTPLGDLEAKEFGAGMLQVLEDKALDVSLTPGADGVLHVMVSLRIAASERFIIGGDQKKKRDVTLTYDAATKKWHAVVALLFDAYNEKVKDAPGKPITGFAFPVSGSGIYLIDADVNGKAVTLLDHVKTDD